MKICFVTLEIAPTTWGGAGVLISETTKVLTDRGHEVVLVLDIPRQEYEKFQWEDRILAFRDPNKVRAYHVSELCVRIPSQWASRFGSEHLWRSFRLDWATRQVAALEEPDVIEFADYLGMAYYALSAKITQGAYKGNHLAVRLHNTIEVMEAHQPTAYTPSHHIMYALEHQSLRIAEHVLYPSQSYLEDAYKPYYPEQWLGDLHHSPPPLTNPPVPVKRYGKPYLILFYGRLFGFKGVDRFVDAAIALLAKGVVPPGVRFALVGNDSSEAPDGRGSYQQYLLDRIPRDWRHRFDLTGYIDRSRLEELLPNVMFAAFPNYFESFGYAIHEIYEAKVPVIVNDIPAFRDYFHHMDNALVTDGTVRDLSEKMHRLLSDDALRERLRKPRSVVNTEIGEFYEKPGDERWSKPTLSDELPDLSRLVICVLDDDRASLEVYEPTSPASMEDCRIIRLSKTLSGKSHQRFRFLGNTYASYDEFGFPTRELPETREYLLIIGAGDVIRNGYPVKALQILDNWPKLSFVSGWKSVRGKDDDRNLDPLPLDCLLETVPFADNPLPTRAIMRTNPGIMFSDLFELQLEHLGEIEYLWRLEEKIGPGVNIPEALVEITEQSPRRADVALRSLMVNRESSPTILRKTARYLLAREIAHEIGLDSAPGKRDLRTAFYFRLRVAFLPLYFRVSQRLPWVVAAKDRIKNVFLHDQ